MTLGFWRWTPPSKLSSLWPAGGSRGRLPSSPAGAAGPCLSHLFHGQRPSGSGGGGAARQADRRAALPAWSVAFGGRTNPGGAALVDSGRRQLRQRIAYGSSRSPRAEVSL